MRKRQCAALALKRKQYMRWLLHTRGAAYHVHLMYTMCIVCTRHLPLTLRIYIYTPISLVCALSSLAFIVEPMLQ